MYSVTMPRLSSCLLTLSAAIAVNAQELTPRAKATPCPGVNYLDDTTSGCCVGGTVAPVFLSVCDGWPICNGPTTTTTTSTPLSCATLVAYTDANYLSEISSLADSMDASGTTYCTTMGVPGGNACSPGPDATSTTTDAPNKSTSSKKSGGSTATKTSTQDQASSTSSSTTSSSSSGGATSASTESSGSTQTTGTQSTTASGATNTSGANALGKEWGVWALASTAIVTAWFGHIMSSSI